MKKNTALIIGTNLKDIRIEKDLTQKEFSELLDMNYQNYSQLERGLYKPGLDKLIEIADTLKVTPNDLLLSVTSKIKEKQYEENLRLGLSGIQSNIIAFEPYLAKADQYRELGELEKEKLELQKLFNHLVFNNKQWREVTEYIYYKKLDDIIRRESKQYRKNSNQKILDKLIKKG